jgi:hypothetical protein
MAFGSDRSANFVIAAKDAATAPLGKIGKAMGSLKKTSVTAFKAIAGAAIAAATAIAGFVTASIANAIADERSQIRLIAALEARGLATEKNTKKIEEAIIAGQKYAFTGEQVRTSLEIATQFTNKFNKALAIQRVAQDLAIAKNISLESATQIVGKAFAGNGKALKNLGIELSKVVTLTERKNKFDKKDGGSFYVDETITKQTKIIKGQAALNAITEKYGGIADAVAESTAGRLAAAQERFNAAIDDFGKQFLPVVAEIVTFLTDKALPAFQKLLDEVGPVISEIVDDYVRPLLDSVGELFDLFDKSDFNPFILALDAVKLILDGIKIVIDLIVAGLKLIGIGKGSDPARELQKAAEDAGYGGGSYINPMNRNMTPGNITTNTNLYLDGSVVANSTNSYIGGYVTTTNGSRNTGRYP